MQEKLKALLYKRMCPKGVLSHGKWFFNLKGLTSPNLQMPERISSLPNSCRLRVILPKDLDRPSKANRYACTNLISRANIDKSLNK